MKAVMLMFDSLNKHMLSAYGCKDTFTPNFARLAKRSLKFNRFYVGSMPCMPARRELHTGRYNFLHRGWGPVEPFDDSMPELLKKHGVHTHLVTDHKHYWRDGGATYHSRFSTYEFVRGQEGDSWKGVVDKPQVDYQSGEPEENKQRKIASRTQHLINSRYMMDEKDHPLARTIGHGLEFIETNHMSDQWFLQLECFDPHEPFFVPDTYLAQYGLSNKDFDGWPPYYVVEEDVHQQATVQGYYKALLTMVDAYVGKVMDIFDKHDLWRDTMLVLNTDHGFLLGEHEWWGKNIMPLYNEIANTPFFMYHPDMNAAGERNMLAQTIDIAPTLLDYFRVEKPKDMLGESLLPALQGDKAVRDHALFGYHGCHINITDGDYVYMRAPVVRGLDDLHEYTLMPTRINRRFTPTELSSTTLHPGFSFTKGCSVMKVPTDSVMTTNADRFGHKLYNVKLDPQQLTPVEDVEVECRLVNKIRQTLMKNDAPTELYQRYGLSEEVSMAQIQAEHLQAVAAKSELDQYNLLPECKHGVFALLKHLTMTAQNDIKPLLFQVLNKDLSTQSLFEFVIATLPADQHNAVLYKMTLDMRLR